MNNFQDYIDTYDIMGKANEGLDHQKIFKSIGFGKTPSKDVNLIWSKDDKIFGYFEGWNFKPLGNEKSTMAALTKMGVINDEVDKKQQKDVALMVKMAKQNGECTLKKK